MRIKQIYYMNIKDINVNFDFTSDTKGFWDGFWDRNDGLGAGGADPDSKSKTLRLYIAGIIMDRTVL